MSKSLATESSAGVPKKKHSIEKLVAIMAAILLALGLTSTAAPAFAAAAGPGVTVTITPTEGTGSGTITASSIRSDSVQLLVKVDGVQVNVLNTVSGGTGSWADAKTTLPLPYSGLLEGQVLTVEYPYIDPNTGQPGSTVLKAYTQPALPDPISSVFAEAPVSNGTQVTIPVVTGYKYVDVTGATLTGVVPIPVGGSLEVSAVSTSPTVALEGTTTWLFGYVAPAPVMARPPQPPVANDVDGVVNDTITVFDGNTPGGTQCWSNPLINGVSVAPGTHNVLGLTDGKGNVIVSYTVLAGCRLRDGSPLYSFPAIHFSDATLPTPTPTETAEPTPTPTPTETAEPTPTETATPAPTETAAPTPTETETAAPAPTPSTSATPTPTQSTTGTTVTTSETGATVQQQEATTQRHYVVQTAAAGQTPLLVEIGRVLIAAGILLLVVSVALSVKRRRFAE